MREDAGPGAARAVLRIDGDGPVAVALALLLRAEGVPASAIARTPSRASMPGWLSMRSLALSAGSLQVLARLGVQGVAQAPIRVVEVSLRGAAGRCTIDARDLDPSGAPLGAVLRYGPLLEALDTVARRVLGPVPEPSGGAAARGDEASIALTVHADGDPGEDADCRDSGQHALLGEVVAADDRPGVAFERFTGNGPLALLPLPEPGRRALVWCDTPAEVSRRAALPGPLLERELLEAFGPGLGPLRIDAALHATPLLRRMRRQLADGLEAWIGNAAQSLHPVAGQGLNLGLRDAVVLARTLGDAFEAARRDGAHAPGADALRDALARHARQRRADRERTVGLTDALAELFTWPVLRPAQSFALAGLDATAPARRTLARRLMFGLR